MPNAAFFQRLGVFILPHFFDEATCSQLRAAARAGDTAPATVSEDGEARKLAPAVRSTLRATVPAEMLDAVASRVQELKPAVENHFGLSLAECQRPQFLVYRVGDFFSRHADGGDDPSEPPGIRARKVSVVVFLTTEANDAGPRTHAGGSLVFYDLLGDARLATRGLPLSAEEGMLVAFRANTVHSVNPVIAGERHSIVTWFV